MKEGDLAVQILWHATPWRGDKFEEIWRPVAASALDYGASWWALLRSREDPLDFTQLAVFASKHDFERYWYSEEIASARAEASGYFSVPVTPLWLSVMGAGQIEGAAVDGRGSPAGGTAVP